MNSLLHQSVTQHASNRPGATAVVESGKRLTYGELDRRSNQVARALNNAGCGVGDRVCFAIPKSIDAIVAIIGILKAGCIYTPLDVSSPPARLERIINACDPTVILASSSYLDRVKLALSGPAQSTTIGVVDGDVPPEWAGTTSFGMHQVAAQSDARIATSINPGSTAYILFTSGSTGAPKGVPISHANVTAFVDWANGYFGVGETDRLSGHTALHFDLSVYDIFGALSAGAELHLVPPEVSLLPSMTADFIRESELTQWFSVPSVLNFMYKFDVVQQDEFPDLKRIIWCGEVLPTPALIHLIPRLPHVAFTNLYGPTEATIASSYYTVPAIPGSPNETIPIGTACEGESLFILGDDLKPLNPSGTGDLYIGGAGLSTGYWRDDEKTSEAFIDPPDDLGVDKLYKTGDLAYLGTDGLVYFVGRSDTQIKSRGYRIELGEIETALSSIEQLVESTVVAVESDGFESTVICCAYVLAADVNFEPADIIAGLKKFIPSYMIPSRWQKFEQLPKNSSGKIDRVAVRNCFRGDAP